MRGGAAFYGDSPYRASRTDANQSDIVSAFRKRGYSVECLHAVGNGVFDLMISKRGLVFNVEVKDGEQDFSSRQFTKKQRKWNFSWQGMKCVAKCLEDVETIDSQITHLLAKIKAAGIELKLNGCMDLIYHPSLY